MNQLNPGQQFPIYYEITDPTESGTNYARAFIRNTRTDVLIDTINLTDLGSNRFQNVWQVIDDPSGQGLHISITVKIYTDSAYTTLNNNYLFKNTEYVIAQRWGLQFGNGGGADIDYKKIRKILAELLDEKIKPQDLSSLKFNPKDILEKLEAVIELSNGLSLSIESLPAPEKLDLSSVLTALKDLNYSEKLATISTDLAETRTGLAGFVTTLKDLIKLRDEIKKLPDQNKVELKGITEKVDKFLLKAQEDLKTAIGKVKFTITSDLKLEDVQPKEKEKVEEKPKRDFNRILPYNLRTNEKKN